MMDYGPDWPPRQPPATRRRRPDQDPIERFIFFMFVAGLLMIACVALWQSAAPVSMNTVREARPAPHATGPAVADHAHHP